VEPTSGRSQAGLPLLGAARAQGAIGESTDGDWILPLVRRAQERVMQQKTAFLTMGMTKSHYIENLQGRGHLSIRRLGMLGEDFWRAFIDELREHFGLDNDEERLKRARELRAKCDEVIDEIARKGLR
jgi:hypothetical protein